MSAMNMTRIVISLLWLSALLGSCVSALTVDETAKLDNYIRTVMDCRHLGPGVSVTMVKGGEVVYSNSFGVVDVETQEPVTQKSKFCIGSATKSFTATLLGNLLTENKQINFDTLLSDILGDNFTLIDTQRSKHASLRDVLVHDMGVQRFDGCFMTGGFYNTTRAQAVRKLKYLKEALPFRSYFMYNNWMYMLAGYAAEKISGTGQTCEQLISDRILKPLGMDTAAWVTPDLNDWSGFALPHAYTLDGYRATQHSGNIFGYQTVMWLLPDLNVGVTISCNGPSDVGNLLGLQMIVYHALDILSGEPSWLNETTACSFPEPWARSDSEAADIRDILLIPKDYFPESSGGDSRPNDALRKASLPLDAFIGLYSNDFAGSMNISLNTDRNSLYFRHGTVGNGYMTKLQFPPNSFKIDFEGPLWFMSNSTSMMNTNLYFSVSDDDDVTQVTVPWFSADIYPVFTKDPQAPPQSAK
ncbi:PREDICTED: uncharacterized protein LOC106805056 [Priapulus caudatus]|uniref:Uncharacterized protein LOC106805056 n=1 Tax=Priapulus caudatus TaxID=37621 RepID=A0ABM1DPZ3_PRICU|nr:PREDICTED: uncharacterized protein LOC106805056 [Priapulus caudatus]